LLVLYISALETYPTVARVSNFGTVYNTAIGSDPCFAADWLIFPKVGR
jgi:hypothetical protein